MTASPSAPLCDENPTRPDGGNCGANVAFSLTSGDAFNVACGGTLVQHLPDHYGHHEHRRVLGSFDGADHEVELSEGSSAAAAAGELAHATKSHHHQGVELLGDGLVVTGVSTLDELPEAIELPHKRFVLGVQWHPEADQSSRVISGFVEAARRVAADRGKAAIAGEALSDDSREPV